MKIGDVETIAVTGSTNADLIERISDGKSIVEGHWLRAERQTGGKGRDGRQWISPLGNLYCSTVVQLRATDPIPQTLSLVAGLAVHDLLMSQLMNHRDFSLELKWPNDLLCQNAKIAGILCERVNDSVIVGIGINVTTSPSLPDRETISIHEQNGKNANYAGDVLKYLIPKFKDRLSRWRLEPLENTIAEWKERAHAVGTLLKVHGSQREALQGEFAGLDANGALLLRLANGAIQSIHAGDVSMISEGIG